ncbi:OmpA family protein [Vibrio cincinnatiensis]|nr:OmpA family protein [Vibrio cincinnatiensis]
MNNNHHQNDLRPTFMIVKNRSKIIKVAIIYAISFPILSSPYLGAKFGKSWLNSSCNQEDACSKEGSSIGLYIGYDFSNWLALEADYIDLGSLDIKETGKEKLTYTSLSPTLKFEVSPYFNVFSKLGLAKVSSKNIDDYALLGAAGMDYRATNHISLRLEYQRVNHISHPQTHIDTNTIMLGMAYVFPSKDQGYSVPVQIEGEERPSTVIREKQPQPITREAKTYLISHIDFGKAEFTSSAKQQLDHVVSFLYSYSDATVMITGHTDSTGPAKYNQVLSEKRAEAAANYLAEKGVDKERIHYQGKGEDEPLESNATLEGRQKNRRVDMMIHY